MPPIPAAFFSRRVHISWIVGVALAGGMLHAEEPAFAPWKTSHDPVAILWERICHGQVSMDVTSPQAFLRQLLRELEIPVASQVLVFSKTSLQNSLISPRTPRAIYFSEEAYAGWCQDGLFELIGIDPENGPQFYTLSFPYLRGEKPELATSETCVSCHESSRTEGVNGMLVRSVYTDENGQPLLREGSFVTGHESPLRERWGGWYVTGRHGGDLHMGNAIARETETAVLLDRTQGANVTNLESLFPTRSYLTNSSDLVALMVLEHQCTMHNLITAAGRSSREAMARQRDLKKAFGEQVTEIPEGSAAGVIHNQAEKLLKHLLYCREYPLQDDGVDGGDAFQEAFRGNRRESKDGRSLKDFQLLNRLFKYRCSYMIYSKSFDALPPQLKSEVAVQLNRVLSSADNRPEFAHLSSSERATIRQILVDTKPDVFEASR